MPVTQQEIADAVGTSRGTVDRVLNNRGKVKPELRDRILRAAQEMNYRPNMAGRALAMTRQPMKIGVILQAAETPFMERVLRGVQAGTNEALRVGISVETHCLNGMDADRTAELLRRLCADGCRGVALVPSEGESLIQAIHEAARQNIPVVTFNVDVKDAGQFCFVGQNSEQSGRTVAGLMAEVMPPNAKVLTISGNEANAAHTSRIGGFREELALLRPDLKLLNIEYNHDSRERAQAITEHVLQLEPNLKGIYIASAGVTGVCDALARRGLQGKIRLISHDLVEENVTRLKRGEISFLIGQDAYAQGCRPIQILVNKLYEGKDPKSKYEYTHIDIRTRYNFIS